MCGIGGRLSFDDGPDPGLAERMNACMTHRGPDMEGVYADGPAVLAHRRLSILDLSAAGRQPMSNATGAVHVVFNGEIYNYRELRDRLDQYSFESETDTEVLLHCYEEYGVDCLAHLRGMFAFAIWDEREERLFLARDRLGQKPLFYRDGDDQFTFGSTIPTVLADHTITPEPDLEAIRSYLNYMYVPSPRTGFEGIRQLPPAHYLIVSEGDRHRERYWRPSFADQFDASPARIAERLREKLREATRLRMRSDVPLGVFLSGGIDSSAVTALMADVAEDPVQTYSIGFDVEEYDELDFAGQVADRYDTDHTEYTLSADTMLDTVDDLLDHYGMPFGDSSALPTYHVSRLASDDVTVVLTGDAGDENFAGYKRYRNDAITSYFSRVPGWMRRPALAGLDRLPAGVRQNTAVRKPRRALELAPRDPIDRHAAFVCHRTPAEARRIWTGPEPDEEFAELRAAYAESDGPTDLDRFLYTDLTNYLPDDVLLKVDRASMAHSLEVRSPFLDHEFVEFAARIPATYKWRRGEGKWILKRAFRDLLPDPVVDRKKQGFGVPVHEWIRGDLQPMATESIERLGQRPPFDGDAMREELADHLAGRRDYGYYLWDLIMLEKWYERYVDG